MTEELDAGVYQRCDTCNELKPKDEVWGGDCNECRPDEKDDEDLGNRH